MARTKGAKAKKKYNVSPSALRQRQTVPLVTGNQSPKFKKYLEEIGFNKVAESNKIIKKTIEDNKDMLDLIQKQAITREILLEAYKYAGDVGINMLNRLRELDMALNRMREKYRGREDEMLSDRAYQWSMEELRKLDREVQRLGLDKSKFMFEQQKKKTETDVIDIDVTVLEGD